MRICILADLKRYERKYHILHPVYRWKKQLEEEGYTIKIVYSHTDKSIYDYDKVLIVNRYFSLLEPGNSSVPSHDCLAIRFINKLKDHGKEVIWFDAYDTSGSPDFRVIKHVDVFLKKQVLKNRELYTRNLQDQSVRVWLKPSGAPQSYPDYYPCPADMLHKIRVGWNIGYCDYRLMPKVLRNYYFNQVKPFTTDTSKPYSLTFRGNLKYDDQNLISQQRNRLIDTITQLRDPKVNAGPPVSYRQYIQELSQSKVCVSPFGWGEICLRDFEAILAGSLLIKPSMEHIDTFPKIYIPNQTYLPISWDMSDLKNTIEYATKNYEQVHTIAAQAQELYLEYINEPQVFITQFKKSVRSAERVLESISY